MNENTIDAAAFQNTSGFNPEGGELDLLAGWYDEDVTAENPSETDDGGEVAEEQPEPQQGNEVEADEAPTTEPENDGKLTFTAKIDHREQEVSISLDDLPALYQKAANMDRAVKRADEASATAARLQSLIDKGALAARAMEIEGDSNEDVVGNMFDTTIDSFRQTKVESYVAAGMPKDAAEVIANQQLRDAQEKSEAKAEVHKAEEISEDDTQPTRPTVEQFTEDFHQLVANHPELQDPGKQFPDEVMSAYMNGQNLEAAYLKYERDRIAAEYKQLRDQNAILQQNQASAKRAPIKKGVSSVAGNTKAEDPYLAGWYDDDY